MSNILEKIGIYDLLAVLLSGICISTFTVLVLQFVYEISIDVNTQINETLLFFVVSYFLGLIFQEISSFIQKKILKRNNRLLQSALKTSNSSSFQLTDTEKNGVYAYVVDVLELDPNEENDNTVYNYCKYYVLENKNTSLIDKDQSISSMGRSLSLYFAILSFMIYINNIFQPSIIKNALVISSIFFSVLLFYRYVRFAKLRYVNIFRLFYYNVVVKKRK